MTPAVAVSERGYNDAGSTVVSLTLLSMVCLDTSSTVAPTFNPSRDRREHRLAHVALAPPTGSSATLGDGLAEIYQRSLSSYDDGAPDGTAALAGRKIHASVGGEATSSASVPARSANNGPP